MKEYRVKFHRNSLLQAQLELRIFWSPYHTDRLDLNLLQWRLVYKVIMKLCTFHVNAQNYLLYSYYNKIAIKKKIFTKDLLLTKRD